jgi:flagellar motility protein MotE (MotC chaperone)
MKTKSAARILNSMERDRAAQLSTAFSTLDDP